MATRAIDADPILTHAKPLMSQTAEDIHPLGHVMDPRARCLALDELHQKLLTSIPTVDDVLDCHASALGHDFIAYRNYVYRVVNLCIAIVGDRVELEKIAVAGVFHDLGIWTSKTFDYIAPSVSLAREYLTAHGRVDWIAETERMIADHHKITPSSANPNSLVEPFRRADWIDVTRGLRRFGIPRSFIASVLAAWPSAGFHWRLVQLTLERCRTHPLTPLPMVRL